MNWTHGDTGFYTKHLLKALCGGCSLNNIDTVLCKSAVTDSHSVHNNPWNLSCTAENCDLSLPQAFWVYHSTCTLVRLDCAPRSNSIVTDTHTHCLFWAGQNGLWPTPDNLHLGCSYYLHSSHHFFFHFGIILKQKPKTVKQNWNTLTTCSANNECTLSQGQRFEC